MCGPTPEQTELQDQQIQAYQQAQQMTQEQYANYQAIAGPLTTKFQSIFNQGPNQEGFSPQENETLRAQSVEGTAENYSSAAKALNEAEVAKGGGNNPISTGGEEELKEELASSAAGEESKEQTGIQEADFEQGLNDWKGAAEGLESLAEGANPVGYENAATGSGSAADTEANAIASEEDQWVNAVSGAAVAVGAGWASGGFKH